MMRFTTGQRLRFEEADAYLQPVLDAESLPEALDAFELLGPITGNVGRNRETVEEQQRRSPLSSIFPPRRVDGDGLPRFTPSTEEERLEFHLAATETMHITFSAGLIAEALDRIRERFGIPTVPELVRHFARSPIVPVPVATALAARSSDGGRAMARALATPRSLGSRPSPGTCSWPRTPPSTGCNVATALASTRGWVSYSTRSLLPGSTPTGTVSYGRSWQARRA